MILLRRTGWNLITAGAYLYWSSHLSHSAATTSSQVALGLLVPEMSGELEQLNGNIWRVTVSDDWDVLGPFPIHAREQHFLSPSFPLNLSSPIDLEARWPSSYADGGTVGWTKAVSDKGNLGVSFPDIRWASLRATEGWAALQHHTVLRTTVTVHPPSSAVIEPPTLLVSLTQGSFFTVRPSELAEVESIPRWYTGNIYAMTAAPPQSVDFPVAPSTSGPTTYDLFVSGDYEIRLFGDPVAVRNSQVPKLQITVEAQIEERQPTLVLEESHHVVPDFVDGWAFGDALGVGLRSVDEWWTVKRVSLTPGLAAVCLHETTDQDYFSVTAS